MERTSFILDQAVLALIVTAFLAFTATASFLGCSQKKDSKSAGPPRNGNPKAAVHPGKGRASLPPVPVTIEKAVVGSISSYYTATATLEAEKQAEILARISGVIEKISCEEGDLVARGEELLRIDNAEYSLKLAEAEAKTANLLDKHKRMKDMWKKNLVSEEEYNTVSNDLKAAEAAEELARLNLSYTTVTAPFSGKIVSRRVDVGQNVSAGTALFAIADFDPLLAKVHVPSKEFKKLKPDQTVELILDSDGTVLKGRIKLISPIIDPTSGTIKITVEISDYPPHIRPGDFAEVRIMTDRHDGTVLVPKNAVFTDKGDRVLFVALQGTAERRVIDVGFEDEFQAEILSGVEAGEQVIVKGQRSLKHGAPIRIMNASKTAPGALKRME